uniref:SFRICE_015517 n=1 Tax=Spodoptera frugiperda TaxID=7108 RepID=A0A2H1WN03_SPOFR
MSPPPSPPDTCCRVARSQRCMSEQLVLVSALCALEAVPLRFNYFAAFWTEVANSPADSKLEEMLVECSVAAEYVDAVLLDERDSLEDPVIYQFMQHYYPKLGGGASSSSSSSSVGGGAAEALLEQLVSGGARGPLRALLAAVRALTLLHARAPPDPARARDLLRATRAIRTRLQQATEDESSEPENGCTGGPSNTTTRAGSGSGSSGDDAASEPAEPDSEPDEATPRGAGGLAHLALALDALDALANAATAPPVPPHPPPEP